MNEKRPPKVSVLMSVKNGEKYVLNAIKSIVDQTFDRFEFLIMDDASEDGTWDLIKGFDDERIRLFRNESNQGLTKSLNKLIRHSRGEYIARIDADDMASNERLEVQNQFLDENTNTDVVGSFCRMIDENCQHLGDHCPGLDADCLKWSLIFRNVIKHSTVMWRKHMGLYDDLFEYAQDHEMWSRSRSPYVLKKNLAEVRVHPESLTWKKNKEQKLFSLEVTRRQIQRYSKIRVDLKEAKIIKLISIHKTSSELKEFESISDEEIKNNMPIYMKMAEEFFRSSNKNPTIIDEISWDFHGLFELRSLQNVIDQKEFFKKLIPNRFR
jgi:glycosyltransferase involved in cell wall biosynthesis